MEKTNNKVKSCYLKECSHEFWAKNCHFCEEPIHSYVEVRGFYIGGGLDIDEVIPICHMCWIKKYYTWEIEEHCGSGKSYYSKKDLEDLFWDKEEIRHLSEYYHQQKPKEMEANQFISHWFSLGFGNELKETAELLEKEREWSECYDWIHQLRFEITPSEGHEQFGENFRYKKLKKNPRLKELYEKIEKVDIEELWKKEVQKEVIPIYKEIITIRTESRKNNICSLCFSNSSAIEVNLVFLMDHLAQEHKDERKDYLCRECIKDEIEWRESENIKNDYFEGIEGERYKALKEYEPK